MIRLCLFALALEGAALLLWTVRRDRRDDARLAALVRPVDVMDRMRAIVGR